MSNPDPISRYALNLGYAGLLPQIICIALELAGGQWQWVAMATAWAYAAIIFSFLGGIWWGLGIAHPALDRRVYIAAVLPSLIALASYIPWTLGWTWPGPSLVLLGVCLMATPLVDRWIASQITLPIGWMKLRVTLSLGLGGMSLILAMLA